MREGVQRSDPGAEFYTPIFWGPLWGFLGPVLFVLYMNRFQIGPEERVLRGLFGEAYDAYAARVRRWL